MMRLHPIEALVLCAVTAVGSLWLARAREAPEIVLSSAPVLVGDTVPYTTRQLVMIYVGDVGCAVCTSPEFKADLSATLEGLRGFAEDEGYEFYPVAVLLNGVISESVDYLGGDPRAWAETSFGGGWQNSKMIDYVWSRNQQAVTPQLHIFTREIYSRANLLMVTTQSRIAVVSGSVRLHSIVDTGNFASLLPSSGPSHER